MGMESIPVAKSLVSGSTTVSQLGPREHKPPGWAQGMTLPLTTNKLPRVPMRPWGYVPTARDAVSPVTRSILVMVFKLGLATYATVSLRTAVPVAPDPAGRATVSRTCRPTSATTSAASSAGNEATRMGPNAAMELTLVPESGTTPSGPVGLIAATDSEGTVLLATTSTCSGGGN